MFRFLLSTVLILLYCVFASSAKTQIPPGFQGGAEIAKGKFLVATRALKDRIFAESVVLLVRYDPEATIGLIINHPTQVKVSKAFPDLKQIDPSAGLVYFGGPVAMQQMFLAVNSGQAPPEYPQIIDDLYVSADTEWIRKRIARPQSQEKVRFFLGCASWSPGQLEAEILEGNWNLVPAELRYIFDHEAPDVWKELNERGTLQQT